MRGLPLEGLAVILQDKETYFLELLENNPPNPYQNNRLLTRGRSSKKWAKCGDSKHFL